MQRACKAVIGGRVEYFNIAQVQASNITFLIKYRNEATEISSTAGHVYPELDDGEEVTIAR
jgi:hypothetical protein